VIHVPREIERDLAASLTALSGYRQARWRAVILYGMAGIGKTALARAVADDDQVTRAFRDGIAWVDGNRDPEDEVLRLCLGFGLERAPGERWLECWRRWAGAAERRLLLIVDDAVMAEGLPPLIAGLGPQVVALITTQQGAEIRAEVERWLPAGQILAQPVAGLTPAEGGELVEAVAGRPLTEREWAEAQAVGELLGWHAEALRLAAIRGREAGWAGVLGELTAGRLPWAALHAALRRQWARLPAEQQAWLAALLPVAASFTADAASRAWGVAPAVAGYRLWVLAQAGWVVEETSGEVETLWRVAACVRLALAEVVQQTEMNAN